MCILIQRNTPFEITKTIKIYSKNKPAFPIPGKNSFQVPLQGRIHIKGYISLGDFTPDTGHIFIP